ncbi:androgen-dependent TFPI-regulating protein [Bicyclus anynana]|uniref:Androgen-dependent TFPI-regulating protein n=1 Tax=Bicyclus anynana TaxID=110368 RepID=A0A6J1MVS5_BICAN|nr:androgen-dependent TFPI-regulating protein [Bicyclus anynana]
MSASKVNITHSTTYKQKYAWLKFRWFIYLLSFVHLVTMAIRFLIEKDFENSEDVTIRVYAKFKWKLITTWFNLLFFVYIPVCLYCDWRELKGNVTKHLKTVKRLRDFMFTSLVLPTTAFADILFWRLWHHDKDLIAPPAVDSMIHLWEHHCMHTISLLFVIFDFLFVRRKRPKNMAPGIITLTCFISLYIAVCVQSVLNEEYLYPVFKKFSYTKLSVLAIYTYISVLFYHTGQWVLVDLIHGQTVTQKKRVY